jgi:hypothetical protein
MKNVMFLVSGMMVLYVPDIMAQNVPTPDHVMVVLLENEGYGSIIGNSNCPFINSLANDPANAVFTQSFALTHPSQPNYLMLYSGDNQGVTNDNNITNAPYSTPNLGAALITAGLTFKGYSEDLPAAGALDYYYANYARKHAPWTNWQGTGNNRVPGSVNQPFTSFPTNFNNLPTVSFVIPNQVHNMHDPPSNPSQAIANGDAWIAANLTSYITWAKTHNSLLILTFDEDGGSTGNNITTIFMGEMVNGGNYSNHIDHYNVLRTIEDMYGLPYAGASANKTPITNCWVSLSTGVSGTSLNNSVAIGPIPAHENFTINMNSTLDSKVSIIIYDIAGRLVKDDKVDIVSGKNTLKVDVYDLSVGAYIVKLKSDEVDLTQKIILE